MTKRQQNRSGLIVFGLLAVLLLGTIGTTVLLANNNRNLNLLLTRLGYEPVKVVPIERALRPYELKGNRLPRPKVVISRRLIAPTTSNLDHYIWTARKSPKLLCAALGRNGFVNYEWKESAFDKDSWECQSYREFPIDREGATAVSSTFVSIRGDGGTRISSFRIKLNVEDRATRNAVTEAAISVIRTFLEEIHWEDCPDVFADIRALKEFDFIRFGNRILLKKELGETPRYNFILTPDRNRNKGSYRPDYFNRKLWLPLPDNSRLDAASTTEQTPFN